MNLPLTKLEKFDFFSQQPIKTTAIIVKDHNLSDLSELASQLLAAM